MCTYFRRVPLSYHIPPALDQAPDAALCGTHFGASVPHKWPRHKKKKTNPPPPNPTPRQKMSGFCGKNRHFWSLLAIFANNRHYYILSLWRQCRFFASFLPDFTAKVFPVTSMAIFFVYTTEPRHFLPWSPFLFLCLSYFRGKNLQSGTIFQKKFLAFDGWQGAVLHTLLTDFSVFRKRLALDLVVADKRVEKLHLKTFSACHIFQQKWKKTMRFWHFHGTIPPRSW